MYRPWALRVNLETQRVDYQGRASMFTEATRCSWTSLLCSCLWICLTENTFSLALLQIQICCCFFFSPSLALNQRYQHFTLMEAALIGRPIMACCARCSDHHTSEVAGCKLAAGSLSDLDAAGEWNSKKKVTILTTKLPREWVQKASGTSTKEPRVHQLWCADETNILLSESDVSPRFRLLCLALTRMRPPSNALAHINFLKALGGVLLFQLIRWTPRFDRLSLLQQRHVRSNLHADLLTPCNMEKYTTTISSTVSPATGKASCCEKNRYIFPSDCIHLFSKINAVCVS